MSKLQIEHVIPLSADEYWRINNQADFEEFQAPKLRLNAYTEIERREAGGTLHRRIRVEPDIKIPGPLQGLLKKNLGNQAFYYEETRDIPVNPDPKRMAYDWEIHPPALADKLHIAGRFIVEPIDDSSCRRTLTGEVKVKILGLGGLVEKFAAGELQKTYDQIPKVVQAWKNR